MRSPPSNSQLGKPGRQCFHKQAWHGRSPPDALIRRCELFAEATRAACYRWLGKTLAVVTDGEFRRAGCPQLVSAKARRECDAGARRIDEALVTFS